RMAGFAFMGSSCCFRIGQCLHPCTPLFRGVSIPPGYQCRGKTVAGVNAGEQGSVSRRAAPRLRVRSRLRKPCSGRLLSAGLGKAILCLAGIDVVEQCLARFLTLLNLLAACPCQPVHLRAKTARVQFGVGGMVTPERILRTLHRALSLHLILINIMLDRGKKPKSDRAIEVAYPS